MRSDIEGVAFDLDGTLYPNYRLNVRLIPFVFKELRFLSAFGKARQIIRDEQENGTLAPGDFYKYQAEKLAEVLSISKDNADLIKEKINAMIYRGWEPIFKKVKLFSGVFETLTALKKSGYKLGLLSDFPPEIKLKHLGIDAFWDAVLCSENSGALKPHPLSFNDLSKAMSLPAEKILYVGNSHSYDVAGAAGAGMKTAWIKSKFIPGSGFKKPRPDFSFHSYRQLYKYMIQ
ncbi:MAG: HAD family hydrolase [Treponema sp.]|nr:HAD family hydrolase [Treponema sp.]